MIRFSRQRPKELRTEICNTVQESVTKTTPPKKKCNKAKRFSEEALKVAEERTDAKGKGKREIYIQLNAEFQRRAKRKKKVLLNEKCKEIEENNRMGKMRD